jgi:hypothetical protein
MLKSRSQKQNQRSKNLNELFLQLKGARTQDDGKVYTRRRGGVHGD